MLFDNHDPRIKYYELMLCRNDLEGLPEYHLPEGYHFVTYKDGDRDAWINIEQSAKEFTSFDEGILAWNRYYARHTAEMPGRMFFIETDAGEKVATATAFYDVFGNDKSNAGWLHWVAVKREYQGKGLSKPLIYHTLTRLQELGYTHAIIPTQTTTWLACKIYLDFGFTPIPENAVHSRDGWRIVKTLTKHPALESFEEATLEEILQ